MGFQLTPESLRKLCRDLKLYSSCPELNDVLHLQCKGITKLENLDAYTGLKTLYLEQNAIADIENLDKLVNLRCLYLGKNMIHSTVGLQALTNLESLDLAENVITKLTNLSKLPLLKTLNVSGNRLATVDDIRDLAGCTQLQSLDMSSNRLEAPEVVEFVQGLPLLYLKLNGNAAVSSYKHYRKTLLARMPQLNYLDDSPVFPKDRRLAVAFIDGGGLEAERAMRETIRREEEETREAHRRAFDAMVERARQQPPEPHDPMRFRAVPPGESDSDEEGLPALYRRRNRTAAAAAAGSADDVGVAAAATTGEGVAEAASGEAATAAAPATAVAAEQETAGSAKAGEGSFSAGAAALPNGANSAVANGHASVTRTSVPSHGSLIVRLEEELRDFASAAAASAANGDGGRDMYAEQAAEQSGRPGDGSDAADAASALLQSSLARLHANVSNMASPAQLQQQRVRTEQLLQQQQVAGRAALSQPDFREELRERAIARAAARAELASAMTAASSGGFDTGVSPGAGAGASAGGPAAVLASPRGAAHMPRAGRPVWRTPDYQRLWNMALQVGEAQEQQEPQEHDGARQDEGEGPLGEALGSTLAAADERAAGPHASASSLLAYGEAQPRPSPAAAAAAAGPPPRVLSAQELFATAAAAAVAPSEHSAVAAVAATTGSAADEAQSIADSAMGYVRLPLRAGSGAVGAGGREADLDSARARGDRVSDLDLRAADVDLDSAHGAPVRVGTLGDIDSARSYSREGSSRGDPEDEDEVEVDEDGGGGEGPGAEGEEAGIIGEDDVELSLAEAASAAAEASAGLGLEERDLFARYSITTYGGGDTSHLRQRRNSSGPGRRSSGAGPQPSPLRRGSGASYNASEHTVSGSGVDPPMAEEGSTEAGQDSAGGTAGGSGGPSRGLQYDSDVELADERASAGGGGRVSAAGGAGASSGGDDSSSGDEVVADPSELLQRARSMMASPGPGDGGAGAAASGSGAGGLARRNSGVKPADLYHTLAGKAGLEGGEEKGERGPGAGSGGHGVAATAASGPGASGSGSLNSGDADGGSGASRGVTGLYELD
ncbi:hypothetical protein GPECTOR_5g192 [Gonium pectorale]|uniref:U2A'/phosphoprotein 32 family A C-terminal domain-containing protein n=1 Tax=Gonium pectorale TaxID=33097 RepID=A0A150GW14_GONPE|nr:hypothetical protein GPECTOR_5g192 [Gonium pectorale]|eukprot:KXZ54087.1 hypothetical protein GPECTOR_5g192 [Gonium pectorale]